MNAVMMNLNMIHLALNADVNHAHGVENMRQKLITLDPTSFEIAQSMPNFSEWVRTQLREYRDPAQLRLELERWEATCAKIAEERDRLKVQLNGWIKCGEEE